MWLSNITINLITVLVSAEMTPIIGLEKRQGERRRGR